MEYQLAPSFNGLAAGSRATLQVPSERTRSLGRIVLTFAGGLTKANITEILVRIGSRVVFGPVSGAQLDAINKWRGMTDRADTLSIDLTEFDGLSVFAKEVGAIDMGSIAPEGVFVEVVNSLASGSPTMTAYVGWTDRQFTPQGNTPGQNRQEQLIHKLLRYVVPSGGGTRLNWQPSFRGAEVKRVHFFYAGTDWTASANGNLVNVECRRNGRAVWDRVPCLINRFVAAEQRRSPQSRVYSLDFVHDNVMSNTLKTAGGANIEFNLELTATDSVTAFVEVLDLPRNL